MKCYFCIDQFQNLPSCISVSVSRNSTIFRWNSARTVFIISNIHPPWPSTRLHTGCIMISAVSGASHWSNSSSTFRSIRGRLLAALPAEADAERSRSMAFNSQLVARGSWILALDSWLFKTNAGNSYIPKKAPSASLPVNPRITGIPYPHDRAATAAQYVSSGFSLLSDFS